MSQQRGFALIVILLIVVGCIGIIVGGSLYLKKINGQKSSVNHSTIKEQNESNPTSTPEASRTTTLFKEYNNPLLGFRFNYPNDWKLIEGYDGENNEITIIALYAPGEETNLSSKHIEISYYPRIPYSEPMSRGDMSDFKPYTVGGVQGRQTEDLPLPNGQYLGRSGGGCPVLYAVEVPLKEGTLVVDGCKPDYIPQMESILDSFKFI